MKNMGRIDRTIRMVLGAGLLIGSFFVEGNWDSIGLLGVLPFATAVLGICPFKLLIEDSEKRLFEPEPVRFREELARRGRRSRH